MTERRKILAGKWKHKEGPNENSGTKKNNI